MMNNEKKDCFEKVEDTGTINESYVTLSDGMTIKMERQHMNNTPVVFDYTPFKLAYGENDDWWYYDEKKEVLHIMIESSSNNRFWELVNKLEDGKNLTKEENEELIRYQTLRDILPRRAVERYVRMPDPMMVAEDAVQYETKKSYRTKSKTEDATDSLPSKLALITNDQYRESLSLQEQKGSYLVPLVSDEDMTYDGKTLFIKGFPASEASIREINKDKDVPIESIDLPLLRMFYSIILEDFMNNAKEFGVVNETVTVYVPDLAKLMGKSKNISKKDIEAIIKKASSFQTICGVLKDPKRPNGIGTVLPLLLWSGYFEDTNTIQFKSPYMTELIRRIYDVSIRKDKMGFPKLKKDGTPVLEAAYSYLVNSSIVKERNKRAVEIVMVVVATIEQAGRRVPHLKARTIMERIPQLQDAYDKATTTNKNRVLSRAFKKAWELLETQTSLRKKYPDIVLPDPNDPQNIPTVTTLDMVFEFPHR